MIHRRRLLRTEALESRLLLSTHGPDEISSSLPVARMVSEYFEEGTGEFLNQQLIEFQLDQPSADLVSFDFATIDGTAKVYDDYRPRTGTVTFHPGQTVQRRSLTIYSDYDVEPDETIDVVFSNPQGLLLEAATATLTLVNDDPPPTARLVTSSILEGTGDLNKQLLEFQLDRPSAVPVSFDFSTIDGTAKVFEDYRPRTGTVTFHPGQTIQRRLITIHADDKIESDETVDVLLSNPQGLLLEETTARLTLINDDFPIARLVTSSILEGTGDLNRQLLEFQLDRPSTQPSSFEFSTVDNTATTPQDYRARTGTVTFHPGQTTQHRSLTILADADVEMDETVDVMFSNPQGLLLESPTASFTLVNDDIPVLTLATKMLAEGDTGTTAATLAFRMDQTSVQPVSFGFYTADGTGKQGEDYGLVSDVVTFTPGQIERQATIPIFGDTVVESDETIQIVFENPQHVTFEESSTFIVLTNDDGPTVQLTTTDVTEGDGEVSRQIEFQLDQPSPTTASFEFSMLSGSATLGEDFRGQTATVTFLPGETHQYHSISILGDSAVELDETIEFVFRNAQSLQFVSRSSVLSILNDDLPVARLATTSMVEGTGDWKQQMLEFQLNQPSPISATFEFTTTDGTAVAGEDYRSRTASVTFHPGQTVQRRSLTIRGDGKVEFDETVDFLLADPQGLLLESTIATLTLINDDLPVVNIIASSLVEGDATNTKFLGLALDRPSVVPVSFDISTISGTATAGVDFEAIYETVTFLPGETMHQQAITILGDNVDEEDKTIRLQFSDQNGVVFGTESILLSLIDDDARPTNIIYIMLDDADLYDVGFNSIDAVTPNIDRLRQAGRELPFFYTASAICSPTRASVLTGNHPLRFGMNTTWPSEPNRLQESKGLRGLPTSVPQLADELRKTEMTTAHFGKWHVGESLEAYRPTAKGFDEWYLPVGNGDTTTQLVGKLKSHLGTTELSEPQPHMTAFITDLVVDYVERQAAENAPFFADIWYYAPHWPWHVPPGFDNSTLNFDLETPRGQLLAMMYEVDKAIGRIVDTLEQHGMLDDTLLIVTSDNGGQNQVQMAGREINGSKGGFGEGGIRVPFVAHWPNEIPANSTNESVMTTTDLLPTLLEFRGLDAQGLAELESQIDGESLVELLLTDNLVEHDPILWQMNGSPTLRADPQASYTYAYRDGDYKIIKYEDRTSYSLYDIKNDPGETRNLASHKPDLLEAMIEALQTARREVSLVPVVPSVVNESTTIPFDPRLDISSGEMTLVFNLDATAELQNSRILFDKPDSWKLSLRPDRSLLLEVTGVDRLGVPAHRSLVTQPLSQTTNEVAVTFGGMKNDYTTVDMYINRAPAASLAAGERPWNIWSSTSSLRIGDESVHLSNIRMHLTRLWPEEWAFSTSSEASAQRQALAAAHPYAPNNDLFHISTQSGNEATTQHHAEAFADPDLSWTSSPISSYHAAGVVRFMKGVLSSRSMASKEPPSADDLATSLSVQFHEFDLAELDRVTFRLQRDVSLGKQ